MFDYLLPALIGYMLGTSNMALYISKIKKVDLRAGGSGNLGASNATMLMGKRAGALTFLHDALKVILAVGITNIFFPKLIYGTVVTAVAGILGHMYPFYLKFKGGKGFASYIGMCFAIDLRFGLIMLFSMLLVALIADWIVAGTFYYVSITPIFLFVTQDWISASVVLLASVCIFYKHIENIKRKRDGQEQGIREIIFNKKN